jgi:hypothetical protein
VSFQEIAEARGLPTAHLEELTWDVEPCAYQRLKVPATAELAGLFQVMHRRALEPQLVGYVLDRYPQRPLERALIAWDVANASLLGRDDAALVDRVARELAPIRPFAQASAAVSRDHVATLVEAVQPASDDSLLDELATETPSLASLVQLTKVRQNLDDQPAIVAAVFAHVKRLELAHLPSLAIAFLQILWDRFAHQDALELLVDLAIDHDVMDAIPLLSGEDERSLRLQTYALVRAGLASFNPVTPQRILEAVPAHVREAQFAPLLLARAELLLMEGKRLDDAAMKLIASLVPAGVPWRYGNYVSSAASIEQYPENAAMVVDSFTTTFGNNPYLWAQAANHEEIKPALLQLISRELRYGSHEPHVWRAASILVSDGEALGNALDQRLATQLTGALGHGQPN